MLEKKFKFTFEDYFNNPKGPRLFVETFLFITTKEKGIKRFRLNNVQLKYLNYLVATYWKRFVTETGKVRYRFEGIREVCLKARQFGLSTLICAILFYDTMVNAGTNTAVFCQDDAASKKMLKKYKLYYENISKTFKPEITNDNETTIAFGKMYSTITSQTPGSSAKVASKKGRSETLRNVHCSEFSEWADAETTTAALFKAVPDSGNIFIEASPKMVGDYFHVMYQLGQDKGSQWKSQFFPWFDFDNNRIDDLEQQKFWLSKPVNEDEEKVIRLYKLDNGQLAWRRKQVDKAGGKLKKFLREEPEDDIACFEGSSELIFPAEVRKINCKVKAPVPGHIYTIGGDVGGGGTYSDDSSITVINSFTQEQVYHKRVICKPHEFVDLLHRVWLKYPGYVGIESNNDVGLSALAAAEKYKDWTPFLFNNNKARGGFWTGHNKRPIIDMMVDELCKVSIGYPGLKISSERIIKEMSWFQVLSDGSYGSPPRTSEFLENLDKRITDDSIMSLMIAYEMQKYTYQIRNLCFKMFVAPLLQKNPKLFDKDPVLKEFYKKAA